MRHFLTPISLASLIIVPLPQFISAFNVLSPTNHQKIHVDQSLSSPSTSFRPSILSSQQIQKKGTSKTSLQAVDTALVTNLWDSYNVALENSPLVTKSITAGVILGAADFTGQKFENLKENKGGDITKDSNEIDIGRTIRFAFFGFVLQAPWNHFYYLLLDGALPPTEDPFTSVTGIKVVIDQFVQAPVFTVLIFLFLGILEGKNLEQVKTQLENDYSDTMVANWKLWVPATVVNLAFCPPPLRVLFLNIVFFFWSIFLSLKLNNTEENNA